MIGERNQRYELCRCTIYHFYIFMSATIHEKVSVVSVFNHLNGFVMPKKMRWQGRDYVMRQFAYHHRVREGRNIIHIFHVSDGDQDYRLRLDTETLQWTLEEVCGEEAYQQRHMKKSVS